MTIERMLAMLNNLVLHGVSPQAPVKAFDPDSEDFEEVSCCVYDKSVVNLYTDEL